MISMLQSVKYGMVDPTLTWTILLLYYYCYYTVGNSVAFLRMQQGGPRQAPEAVMKGLQGLERMSAKEMQRLMAWLMGGLV